MMSKLTKVNFMISLGLISLVKFVYATETPIPEAALKPRNFNPHPYQHSLSLPYNGNSLQKIDYVSLASNIHSQPKNIRQSAGPKNGIFSQGPVQFPSNTDEDNLQSLPHPYESVSLKARNNDKRRIQQVQQYDQENFSKKHYAFSYTVRDAASGDDFSHTQQQQNGAVKGSYKVQLPDGRTQVVKYTADNNGYKAEVSYIDGQHEQVHSAVAPKASPFPVSVLPQHSTAQPLYSSYNSGHGDYVDPYQNIHYEQHLPTVSSYYSSNTAAPQQHQRYNHKHINVENIKIDTYNTAPFQHSSNIVSSSSISPLASGVAILTPTHESVAAVYPTSSTPTYRNIYILPSPQTNNVAPSSYSTNGPSYINSNPNYDYFLDYEYKTTHPTPKASQASILNTNALFYKS